jgi:heat shock protein HtpX
MGRSQHELPRDIGLTLRMVITIVAALALLTVALGLILRLILTFEYGWAIVLLMTTVVVTGFFELSPARSLHSGSREPSAEDEARVTGAVQRLAMVAEMPAPRTEVIQAGPLSWTTALRPGGATIHVGTDMLDLLGERELEAVLAHELAHIYNLDAIVMTALAGPPSFVLAGLRGSAEEDREMLAYVWVFVPFVLLPSLLMLAVSRSLSRYRELAADRVAAVVTGSPAAVAAALLAIDRSLGAMPDRDLRVAASLDSFHFAPMRKPRRFTRLWATHPSAAKRVERLERLEAAMQQR